MENNELNLALKDPGGLSDAEMDEILEAQLASVRKINELLGPVVPSTKQTKSEPKRRSRSFLRNSDRRV